MASLLSKIQHPYYGGWGLTWSTSLLFHIPHFPLPLPMIMCIPTRAGLPVVLQIWQAHSFELFSFCLVMTYHHPQQSLKSCSLTSFRSLTKGHHPNESFPGHSQISTPPSTYTQPHFYFISSFPALFFSPQDLALSYLYFASARARAHTHTV